MRSFRSSSLQDSTYASRGDWAVSFAAFLIAFAVYRITLAHTITLEYSGQFVTAADHLGVARPPGYPLWHILAKGFTLFFSFIPHHGHPNPAGAVNFMSAVFGAIACGVLTLFISRAARHLFPSLPGEKSRAPFLLPAIAGCSSALLFGFCPAFWSQAVIAETHTLTDAFFLIQLNVLLLWITTRRDRMDYLMVFLTGIGLSISPLLILTVPLLLLAAGMVSRKSLARIATTFILFFGFIAGEYRMGKASPSVAALLLGTIVCLVVLFLCVRRTRSTGLLLLLLMAGLIPYAYLPLAASHNAPMNMGYACSWDGFWHVLCRGQYERITLLNPVAHPAEFLEYLGTYLRLARDQFTAPILSIAIIPLLLSSFLKKPARKIIGLLVSAWVLFGAVALLGVQPKPDIQTLLLMRYPFLPSFALLSIFIGLGIVILLDAVGERLMWKKPPQDG